jgi:hypothetical protein
MMLVKACRAAHRGVIRGRGHLVAALSLLTLLAAGCGGGEPDTAVVRLPVVYGQDGRVEPYEEPDQLVRSTALDAGLALMESKSVSVGGDGLLQFDPRTAKELLGLCPDERFADEPAPARCSAVLVRPDLALTAGHCTRELTCEDMVVVRGFAYEAAGKLRPLGTSDLARCKRVLHREPPRDESGAPGLDYAWLELDHPFEGSVSLAVESTIEVVAGKPVVLVGNGVGVPLKLDTSGKVRDTDSATGHFRASVDNFEGGSGAGVFDTAGNLLGIAVTGASDYETSPDGCRRTRVLDDAQGTESITYAARAVEGLCAGSARADLCGAGAASCGVGRGRTSGALGSLAAAIVLCGLLRRRSWAKRPAREHGPAAIFDAPAP